VDEAVSLLSYCILMCLSSTFLLLSGVEIWCRLQRLLLFW